MLVCYYQQDVGATVLHLSFSFDLRFFLGGKYVTKLETITIQGQEWLPINVEDIVRVDHPPVTQPCSPLFFEGVKAIRIELKSGSVRWTNGCRRWWSEKEEELLMAAHVLESRARDLRREASRYA